MNSDHLCQKGHQEHVSSSYVCMFYTEMAKRWPKLPEMVMFSGRASLLKCALQTSANPTGRHGRTDSATYFYRPNFRGQNGHSAAQIFDVARLADVSQWAKLMFYR